MLSGSGIVFFSHRVGKQLFKTAVPWLNQAARDVMILRIYIYIYACVSNGARRERPSSRHASLATGDEGPAYRMHGHVLKSS